jgi:hypothetical protein
MDLPLALRNPGVSFAHELTFDEEGPTGCR